MACPSHASPSEIVQVDTLDKQALVTSAATGTATHDAEYYFADGMIIFLVSLAGFHIPYGFIHSLSLQVEDRLFRIHQFFLARDSEFFRGLFACPPPPGEDVEGGSDEKAIRLEGVTVEEFRCLLRFFYDRFVFPWSSAIGCYSS